jgi:LmbE family N-acetylglucosaminyl deacetylase
LSLSSYVRRAIRTRRHLNRITAFGADLRAAELRVGLPSLAERVLVVSPHPDDESIGCGGTLAQLSARGSRIDVVFMTAGAQPDDAELEARRKEEARAAARVLRLCNVHFLAGQDGGLHRQSSLSEPLAQLIGRNGYQVVFCPWPCDEHLDHQATFAILRDAVTRSRCAETELWFYEVWSPLPANRIVDIDSAMRTKMTAISSHVSQMRHKDYVKLARGLAKTRARASSLLHARYAEAFFVCGVGDLADFENGGASWTQ